MRHNYIQPAIEVSHLAMQTIICVSEGLNIVGEGNQTGARAPYRPFAHGE